MLLSGAEPLCNMACEKPTIRVKQGYLRGVVEKGVYGDKFLAFRGVPYAKPPLGPLRFKEPQSPETWTGIRDASKFGNDCCQFDSINNKYVGKDDCLYLNVYRPINDSPKRAVMVWIHGGGFRSGSGNDNFFGPDYLIRKDIVLVTINYRVGVLGFLNLEHEVAPGNQGLKDQVMALKWVQENISSFGGDPNNVTIFGVSAGGASVHYLTISPLARGLFHKAIAQSGVALNPWTIESEEPSKFAFQLAALLGEHSADPVTVVEFLRKIDAQELALAETKLLELQEHTHFSRFTFFTPSIDRKSPNPFLPEHPLVLMQSGVKVPFILGYTENEGSLFLNWMFPGKMHEDKSPEILDKVNQNFELVIHPELMNYLKKEGLTPNDLKRIYFGDQPISNDSLERYSDFLSDTMFLHGIFNVVKNQQEKQSPPTYFYKFTYDSPNSFMKRLLSITLPGAAHGDDQGYLFYGYILKRLQVPAEQPGTDGYRLIECLTQMWTDFAKTGNPTVKTTDLITTIWEPLRKGDTYNYLNISNKLQMETANKDDQRFEWKIMKDKL